MTSFTTTLYLNDKEYEVDVVGVYSPFEQGTWDSLEVPANFEIQQILVVPNDIVGEINIMTYQYDWLVRATMLEEIKKDFFDYLKGEDYD